MRAAWRALAAAALLATGCTISHESFGRSPPSPAALSVGRTTKAQALAALGPPLSVRRQIDGELFVYRRDEVDSTRLLLIPFLPVYERIDGSARADLLVLFFDRSGLLAGIGEQRDLD